MPAATPLINNDWELRQQQLARMRSQADSLRQGAMTQPSGQMVSGFYVGPSIFERLQPILKAVLARSAEDDYTKKSAQLQKDMQNDAANWMSSAPRTRTEEGVGPTEDGSPLTLKYEPTETDKLGWAQRGMNNPLTKTLAAMSMKDTLVDAPIRREKAQELAAENRRKALERLGELQLRLEDRALDRQSREALAREAQQIRIDLARDANELRRDLAGQSADLRRELSNSSNRTLQALFGKKEIGELDKAMSTEEMLGNATAAISAMPDDYSTGIAPGLVQNYIPGGGAMVAKVRPREVNDAIQQLTYLTDEIRHGRFGTALTATEKASAMQYLPSEYDDKAALQRKAEGLQDLVRKQNTRTKARAVAAGVPMAEAVPTEPQTAPTEVPAPSSPRIRKFNPATGTLE